MRWGLSTCWKEQHFCSGRTLCIPAFLDSDYRLSFHVYILICGRDAQVQPVEGGEHQSVSRHCKESTSLPSVSTSRWAVSCFEVRPVFLVPIWAGTQDLPHMLKHAPTWEIHAGELPQKLQSRVRFRVLFWHVSFIRQVRQRLMSEAAACFVRANVSVSLRTLTTSVRVTGTSKNTLGKPCPLKQTSKSGLCFCTVY